MSFPRLQLLQALLAVLPNAPGIVVIHSSLPDLLPPELGPHDALFAVDYLVRRGWTVALPAFTFSFCRGKDFDLKESPSEVGILADWLLAHYPQARRTPHPLYSFACIGPRVDEIVECVNATTFGDDSSFAFFEREGATIVGLGCGSEYFTQFHRYEETAAVPYRRFKTFLGKADFGNGLQSAAVEMFVRDLQADACNDFTPAFATLQEEGRVKEVSLWRGRVISVGVPDLARVCIAALQSDPFAFVSNAAQASHSLSVARNAAIQPPVRIALLGHSNLHFLDEQLALGLKELMPEQSVQIHTVPYGQLEPELIDEASALHQFHAQVQIFCDRLEDLLGAHWMGSTDAEERVQRYGRLIAHHASLTGAWTQVHRFAQMNAIPDAGDARVCADRVAHLNIVLSEALRGVPQIVWVDLAAEVGGHAGMAVDARLWFVGRFPFPQAFSRQIALRWSGIILSILGKTARVVVLDLDHTLWGGVLGEDGMDGVAIGGDYPGNAFSAFQRVLKDLTRRGVALAVCSKNDDDLAVAAMDGLPAMLIRSADLTARRINWQPKSRNIEEIAGELNVGLESVLFIDDNPVEREAVRRNLPGVKVLDLPSDPALYVQALTACPYVAAALVTEEDRKRMQSFQSRSKLEAQRRQASSLDDYYASLQMRLHLLPLDSGNGQRAAQLCHKTNQFNATTRRHSLRDLQDLVASGADVIVLALEDRNSERENIGLVILKEEAPGVGSVDTYLLSCRVLGRGIEVPIVKWACQRALKRGWRELQGVVVETDRNAPVRMVYRDAGFGLSGKAGLWLADTSKPVVLPGWLTVIDCVSDSTGMAQPGL